MLRIYRAPNGTTWQYEEGEQPEGYEPVEPAGASAKRRPAPANKRRRATTKGSGDGD